MLTFAPVIPESLRGHLLSQPELAGVTSSVAAHSHLWERLVRHNGERRIFEELLTDEHLGLWLICWMEGHDTGFHDHGGSAGFVSVVRGRLREERLRIGGPPSAVDLGAGDSFGFEATDIHRVIHPGGRPAVSIHAYSPPLHSMGSYVVEPTGALRRHALRPHEELRPLAPAAA